ncbi:MAG: hypothetical protein KME28_04165 [Pelatocladus maniniholoensis HA4357-MV3]|jgi:putative transposase|uniref:Uncharacterized protein n=1 Tax=Pelatocladus maniniholoensis HA4357-MV3 TaxID=1117104 RepID=A0A9E3H4W6_9NOST|nr:hypothetical protein [Pelatocladus maniniholoensis HA4357-MV3]
MISQHSQTATLTVGVSQEQSTEGMVVEAIAELQNFIDLRPDAREVRKALAVKLVYHPRSAPLTVTIGYYGS